MLVICRCTTNCPKTQQLQTTVSISYLTFLESQESRDNLAGWFLGQVLQQGCRRAANQGCVHLGVGWGLVTVLPIPQGRYRPQLLTRCWSL